MIRYAVAVMMSLATSFGLPRGTHTYKVVGIYEGETMQPWLAQTIVRDTTVSAKPALAYTHQSRLAPNGWLFTYTAFFDKQSGAFVNAQWINNGRQPSKCTALLENGRIVADMGEHGKAAVDAAEHTLLPEFAVPAFLATARLADNASFKIRPFRCQPGSDMPLYTRDLNAIVTSSTLTKEDGVSVAVWLVTGDKSYPYSLAIAKSDRQILRVTIPQGTVGEMTETYTGTRAH